MADSMRSLRPRHTVDYAVRTAVSKTPGWLRKSEPKLDQGADTATKENQRPAKPAKQAGTTQAAKGEQKQASHLVDELVTAKPQANLRRSRDKGKGKAEDSMGSAGNRARSSRSDSSAEQRAKVASEETAVKRRRTQHASAAEAQEHPLKPSANTADTRVEPYPEAQQEQVDSRKRKAHTAPANSRKKQTATKGKKRRNTTGTEAATAVSADEAADSGAEAQAQEAGTPAVQEPRALSATDASPAQQPADSRPAVCPEPGQPVDATAALQGPPQQTRSLPERHLAAVSFPEQAPSGPSENFFRLQADYSALLKSFQDLSNTKTLELEILMTSQKEREDALVKAAQDSAADWKGKYERLQASSDAGRMTELEKQLLQLQQRLLAEEKRRLTAQKEALEHQEDATQLAFELAKAKEEFSELHTDGRDKTLELQAEVQRLSQLTQPGVREDKAVQTTSIKPTLSAGQQYPTPQPLGQHAGSIASAQTSAAPGSQAEAVPEQRSPSVHLHEAKAWCPEGAEASDVYAAPEHVPGASISSGSWPLRSLQAGSGPAETCSAGKATPAGQVPAFLPADYDSPVPIMSGPPVATGTPALPQQGLVPYPMGSAASHQRTPMTRFAAEALAQPKQSNGSAQAAAGPLKPAAAGTAACQLQYPSGSGNSVALARTPNAGGNAAAQNLITSPQAMGDIEGDHGLVPELDNQAMVHLLGLQGVPSADQGFVYTHPESGYIFELREAAPTSCESSDDEGDQAAKEPEELEYRPLQLGAVSQVLPYYLCDLVRFDKQQKQKVVGRILDALGKWKGPST